MVDFTLVLGVDKSHAEQLELVWPTWMRFKPSLRDHPLVIFYDRAQMTPRDIKLPGGHPDVKIVPWPPEDVTYQGDPESKWYHPQRYKMLAGFVHVPAYYVETPYWLKLDTDVIASGQDDWIDPEWFAPDIGIVAQKWHYTKPPEQVELLDEWASKVSVFDMYHIGPLNLHPKPGSDMVKHPRIISWCGFFNACMTRNASEKAQETCGPWQLPVPSQDGFLWYYAMRTGRPIIRTNMKSRGWIWRNGIRAIRKTVEEVMA